MCDYPGCPQRDVPTPATSDQFDDESPPDVLMKEVIDQVNEGGFSGGLAARAPKETLPIVIPTDQFLNTIREGTGDPRNKMVDEIPTNGGVTRESLEGVKVDEEGIAASDSILEAILSLKEHGYRVLTADEVELEKKSFEARFDALDRDRMEAVKESYDKDEVIQSLASRITEAMATIGAFNALSVRAATITPGSLSRILSRILLDARSPGEQAAFVGVQLSYLPAEESTLTFAGGCMGDDD